MMKERPVTFTVLSKDSQINASYSSLGRRQATRKSDFTIVWSCQVSSAIQAQLARLELARAAHMRRRSLLLTNPSCSRTCSPIDKGSVAIHRSTSNCPARTRKSLVIRRRRGQTRRVAVRADRHSRSNTRSRHRSLLMQDKISTPRRATNLSKCARSVP